MAAADAGDKRYLVLGCKPWNRRVFDDVIRAYPGRWEYLDVPAELTVEKLQALRPRYLFFLHWSWKVPPAITEAFECVCFHMTDVPYGRGGSPLQNLIARGHRQTKLTALRMKGEMDAGPVYGKEDLSLEGNAEEIFIRATQLSARMLARIAAEEPAPIPQTGTPVTFARRKPEESELPAGVGAIAHLGALHDFIRMLDADGYPRAFFDHGGFRYTFSRAALGDGRIVADVSITAVVKR
ncbi:MAG TPA: methionyl-tRNA formyltransferase [Polyangia bacterium]|nr:methionyl-tRNA formyltransferase [Polyangia bacterium]